MLSQVMKKYLLPSWVIGLSCYFNAPEFLFNLSVALVQSCLLFCVIYSVLILSVGGKFLRLLLAAVLTLDVFLRLSYGTTINTNIIMSVANTNFSEFIEFFVFHCINVFYALLNFVVLAFAPVKVGRGFFAYFMSAGLLYLVLPLFPVLGGIYSGVGYEQQLRSARARGLPTYISKIELMLENVSARFTPLHLIKSCTDFYLILRSKIKVTSSWTQVHSTPMSPNLLVLVIGESLRADNMGVYGYGRNTTPKLAERKNLQKIGVVNSAYAAGPTTWTSLPSILSLNSHNADYSKSVINLAKDAGYKTYWISNQGRYGATDRAVAAIAEQADEIFFYKLQGGDYGLDELLLSQLDETLKTTSQVKKRLIVIHFMGSHMEFSQRYPVNFHAVWGEGALLDKYDTSILYSDQVLDGVIKLAEANNGEVLFFADHGLRQPEATNPLTHDNTKDLSLESLKVPLLYTVPSNIKSKSFYSLYYFLCFFSEWSGIVANELNNEQCSLAESGKVKYYDVQLMQHEQIP